MAGREISTMEWTCDGCGKVEVGTLGGKVFGLVGAVTDHRPDGGSQARFFACSERCLPLAVCAVIEDAT